MYRIAIDGPCASGKTEMAKLLSQELNILAVDTGAIYRAIALYCLKNAIDIYSNEDVISSLQDIVLELDKNMVFLNGEDVSESIRTNEVSLASAIVAQIGKVREFVTKIQRDIANKQSVVMQGRDITSVVLPDAELKVYLDASIEERANRRYNEIILKDKTIEYEEVKNDIIKRDKIDQERQISPLIKTEDSVYIDTTYLTKKQVVDKIVELLKEREII